MPKEPKGKKRPSDVIGTAVKVMKTATGASEEDTIGMTTFNEVGRRRLRLRYCRETGEKSA
jgi:hypothetical protein